MLHTSCPARGDGIDRMWGLEGMEEGRRGPVKIKYQLLILKFNITLVPLSPFIELKEEQLWGQWEF